MEVKSRTGVSRTYNSLSWLIHNQRWVRSMVIEKQYTHEELNTPGICKIKPDPGCNLTLRFAPSFPDEVCYVSFGSTILCYEWLSARKHLSQFVR